MNKTFKKIFSVCSAVVTTLTATLFHSTKLHAYGTTPRIVFAGPSQAGKTKLISRICGNSYDSNYVRTLATDFRSTSQITICDTSGDSMFLSIIDIYLKHNRLCVLSISNTNQKTADFLELIAKNNVPNVVLCITKTDVGKPDSDEVSKLLVEIKQKLPNVSVFDEVLYTSAQKNKFKFCKPDKYNASNEYHIYNTETNEKMLAAKLYELCGSKAEDFQFEIYEEGTSYEERIEYDSYPDELGGKYIEYYSFTEKPTTSNGRKYALGFGIPAGLLTLIFGAAYYEYDRHFRKPATKKTETKSEQTPKVNRKISS